MWCIKDMVLFLMFYSIKIESAIFVNIYEQILLFKGGQGRSFIFLSSA